MLKKHQQGNIQRVAKSIRSPKSEVNTDLLDCICLQEAHRTANISTRTKKDPTNLISARRSDLWAH